MHFWGKFYQCVHVSVILRHYLMQRFNFILAGSLSFVARRTAARSFVVAFVFLLNNLKNYYTSVFQMSARSKRTATSADDKGNDNTDTVSCSRKVWSSTSFVQIFDVYQYVSVPVCSMIAHFFQPVMTRRASARIAQRASVGSGVSEIS